MPSPTITLRLACAHTQRVTERPNPRKRWPDPQPCEACGPRKVRRVVEIHTVNREEG